MLQQANNVAGARMIGGGFGGSILILLEGENDDPIQKAVEDYNNKFGKKAFAFHAHSGNSLRVV